MGMGFPLSTPARDAGLVIGSCCYVLLLSRHGLKATAPEQGAKIEWPVPPNTVANLRFHAAEWNGAGGKPLGRSQGPVGSPLALGWLLGIRPAGLTVETPEYRVFGRLYWWGVYSELELRRLLTPV
jgi:hypothetical protein